MNNATADAIYCRVSGERQEKQQTIQTQVGKIHERFDPEGRELYAAYLDDPFTGTLPKRPALDRLINDAWAGCFDRVLIYDPDRLARGAPWLRPMLEAQLKAAGATCRYVYGEQPDTDEGEMMAGITDVLANAERKKILRRTADGLAAKEARGALHWGISPFGWKYFPPAHGERDGHIEQVPEEAVLVREMFDLVLAAKTCYAVANMLEARGLRNRSGKRFTGKSVATVIHNPIHSGQPAKGRYKGAKPITPRNPYNAERKSSVHLQERSEWRLKELPSRIVSPEEQQAAEARLVVNQKRSTRNAKHPFMLSGLMRCGWELQGRPGQRCGRVMGGLTRKNGRRRYECTRHTGADATVDVSCKGGVYADVIEARVWQRILQMLEQPDVFLGELDRANADTNERVVRLTADIAAAHGASDGAQAMLTSLLRKNITGGIDDDAYAALQAELVAQRESAREQIAYLDQELATVSQQTLSAQDFKAYCNLAGIRVVSKGKELGVLYAKSQREIVQDLITAVWLAPDGRIRLEGVIPSLQESITGPIVPPSPWSLDHNSSPSSQPAGYRFSLIIAA